MAGEARNLTPKVQIKDVKKIYEGRNGQTVALNGAKNAAYLAVEILALSDDSLAEKLDAFRADTAAAIAKKDAAIAAEAAAL